MRGVEETKPCDPARPGKTHRVYLKPSVNGALEAYRDDNGRPAVNAVLLELLGVFLEEQGYLIRGTIHRTFTKKGEGHDQSETNRRK